MKHTEHTSARTEDPMKMRLNLGALVMASIVGMHLPATAQTEREIGLRTSSEQMEADYRVIAARCGSVAFERAFFKDSMAAVAAGLISTYRDPVEAEKTITALRRNPFILVAKSADCPAQLQQLKEIQKSRSITMKMRGRK
jgi:hypothetical protein